MQTPKTDDEARALYPETADIETSNDDYATRFRGVTGAWLLEVQKSLTRKLLRKLPRTTLLDVGGGHGQLAYPLADDGWKITILSSAPSCKHRVETLVAEGRATFEVGDVVALPYPDNSFDTVIAFRMATHCEQWPLLISELCRVSRGTVIIDYPTSQSLNAIAPALFKAKKRIEKNTRTWRLFRHSEIDQAFEACGWRIVKKQKQFFFPMVLHRALHCAKISIFIEAVAHALGLTALLGSPVILSAAPKDR